MKDKKEREKRNWAKGKRKGCDLKRKEKKREETRCQTNHIRKQPKEEKEK